MAIRAVYPGSFDPLTNGHLDLIERSLRLFDELVVAVVTNPAKTAAVHGRRAHRDDPGRHAAPARDRDRRVRRAPRRSHRPARRARIIRGLRAVSDFEYEFQMALMNRKLREEVETVFLMPHEAYSYISSRLIKEVAGHGGSVKGLVPAGVEQRLREKLNRS